MSKQIILDLDNGSITISFGKESLSESSKNEPPLHFSSAPTPSIGTGEDTFADNGAKNNPSPTKTIQKKPRKPFEWTPARRASFAICRAARTESLKARREAKAKAKAIFAAQEAVKQEDEEMRTQQQAEMRTKSRAEFVSKLDLDEPAGEVAELQ
jgi:hypothetical protein